MAQSRSTERPILSPEIKERLASTMPTGEPVHPDVVQSWVDITWLTMLEYHPKGITQRIITTWWAKVRPDELERASERLMAIANRQETEKLVDLQKRINEEVAPEEMADVFDLFGTVKR